VLKVIAIGIDDYRPQNHHRRALKVELSPSWKRISPVRSVTASALTHSEGAAETAPAVSARAGTVLP
jgi:hypothetical protein